MVAATDRFAGWGCWVAETGAGGGGCGGGCWGVGCVGVCFDGWEVGGGVFDCCAWFVWVHAEFLKGGGELGVVFSWCAFVVGVSYFTILAAGVEGEEFFHGLDWHGGEAVVFGLLVVDFVDWDGGVDGLSLDGLLVDDGLNSLVDVVVDMFANNLRLVLGRVRGRVSDGDVTEQRCELS